MRIHCIFEEMPIFVPAYLESFLKKRKGQIVSITPSCTEKAYPKMAKKGETFLSYALAHPFQFGLKAIMVLGSTMIYRKIVNSILLLLGFSSPYSVRGVARKYNVPIIDTISVNDQDYIEKLRKLGIDIIISSNGQIFKRNLLNVPRLGCLNIHTSILPSYAGCYPALYVLIANEKMHGVSCHVMEEELDKGTVVAQRRFIIGENDTVNSLYEKVYGMAADVLDEGIDNYVMGDGFPDVSDITPSYNHWPNKSDFQRLFSGGRRFV
jgi:methionyl-tRNA formyltransferase